MRSITVGFAFALSLAACNLSQMQGSSAPTQPGPAPESGAPVTPSGPDAPGAAPGAAPSGPQHASFTLRNSCPQTVQLFYGDKPKFGSGRSSSIGGNSQQGESMTEGDMIWIVDGSGNGVASVTASANVREVTISQNCTGFSQQ